MRKFILACVLALVCATSALAAPITLTHLATYEGNDCAGVFGQSFASCVTPENYGGSPIIAKWEPGNLWILNTNLFPTLTNSMFGVTLNDDRTGHFTYNGAGPDISYVVVKAGNYFNLYSTGTRGPIEFDFNTTPSLGDKALGVSHISVYDTHPVPEPGSTLAMLCVGLMGLWTTRRS